MTESALGTLEHEGWLLTPEGAAVHPDEAAAVVADVHLGYEWARAAAGDCVPTHSLAETLARLERALGRAPVKQLIVAGDLVESRRVCRRTRDDVARLALWLSERKVELVVLAGNHDQSLLETGIDPLQGAPLAECACVAGWTIAHGHRPIAGPRTISGHVHPALGFEGATVPCFVVGPGLIVLPAFTPNAAGRDVSKGAIPSTWKGERTRCLASSGDVLHDLGPLARLRSAMAPAPSFKRARIARGRARSRKN